MIRTFQRVRRVAGVRGERLDEAGGQAGYLTTNDFNGYQQEGFGPYQLTIKDGQRWSAAAAYLRPAIARKNLISAIGARTTKILVEKGRAVGVVFVQDGEHYGGFDSEYLRRTLQKAGFDDIEEVHWRTGRFPGGAIDREQHASYSLYMEARR